jgi:hypothetical protein
VTTGRGNEKRNRLALALFRFRSLENTSGVLVEKCQSGNGEVKSAMDKPAATWMERLLGNGTAG